MKPSNSNDQAQTDANGVEYLDGLYGYAVFLTRDPAQAEDLVEETYLRARRSMNEVRPDGNLKGLLFTILRSLWFHEFVSGEKADRVIHPDGHCAGKMEMKQIQIAIDELPMEFREIILLREHEELSYREISAILQCSVGTVMLRLGRARSQLRTLLGAFESSGPAAAPLAERTRP
jgi:RNA polymerase sigma-70 factor, ECF subfamily